MNAKLRNVLFTPNKAGGWGEWFLACIVAGVVGWIICLISRVPHIGIEFLSILAFVLMFVPMFGMFVASIIRAVYLHFKRQKEVSND